MWNRRGCLRAMAAVAVSFGLGARSHAQRSPTRQSTPGLAQPDDAPSTTRLWQPGDPGERLHIRGRVVSTDGRPVPGAELTLWQADGTGAYQDERYRARFAVAEDGSFQLITVLPGQYWGAKHIHVMVEHPEHAHLTTRILFRGDPNIDETEGDLAIPLEEVRTEQGTVLLGGVEFVLEPTGAR